jgi:hypothetical protein
MTATIALHGDEWKTADIVDEIAWCLTQTWHREVWQPSAALIHNTGGRASQYIGQKFDPEKITLVERGWNHDHCSMCWWTLYETDDDEKGTGYKNDTNAWLCTECFEKRITPRINSEPAHSAEPSQRSGR